MFVNSFQFLGHILSPFAVRAAPRHCHWKAVWMCAFFRQINFVHCSAIQFDTYAMCACACLGVSVLCSLEMSIVHRRQQLLHWPRPHPARIPPHNSIELHAAPATFRPHPPRRTLRPCPVRLIFAVVGDFLRDLINAKVCLCEPSEPIRLHLNGVENVFNNTFDTTKYYRSYPIIRQMLMHTCQCVQGCGA